MSASPPMSPAPSLGPSMPTNVQKRKRLVAEGEDANLQDCFNVFVKERKYIKDLCQCSLSQECSKTFGSPKQNGHKPLLRPHKNPMPH